MIIGNREGIEISLELSLALKPVTPHVKRRYVRWVSPLGEAIEEQRKCPLALPLNSHLRTEVVQDTLRIDAVARAAEHDGSPCEGAAASDERLDRLEEKPCSLHLLVIDVSHRDPDHLRPESLQGLADHRPGIFLHHEIE